MTTHNEWPDLVALELLVSVAETGSIRQAAMVHHISQPAASVRIRGLESALQLRLVERHTTGARLTPDGLAVVGWADKVLAAMRALASGARALRLDEDSQLRLAASLTVAEYLLPTWLAPLYATTPAAVSLRMANSEEVAALFARDEVDLGFVEGASLPDGLQGRTVYRDELVVVVAPGHPWSKRRTPLTAAMLADAPLVSREPGSGTRQVLVHALARVGLALYDRGRTRLDDGNQSCRWDRARTRRFEPSRGRVRARGPAPRRSPGDGPQPDPIDPRGVARAQ